MVHAAAISLHLLLLGYMYNKRNSTLSSSVHRWAGLTLLARLERYSVSSREKR